MSAPADDEVSVRRQRLLSLAVSAEVAVPFRQLLPVGLLAAALRIDAHGPGVAVLLVALLVLGHDLDRAQQRAVRLSEHIGHAVAAGLLIGEAVEEGLVILLDLGVVLEQTVAALCTQPLR